MRHFLTMWMVKFIVTIFLKFNRKLCYIFFQLEKNYEKEKNSIHQEFEKYMRDEMDDLEKEEYIKSKNYKVMINLLTNTLKKLKNRG